MKILKRLLLLFWVVTLIPINTFPLKITNADLINFDSLLEYLSNYNVVELNLSSTNINNKQLADILNQIGGNLNILRLDYCIYLHDFETIKNCTQLQELYLTWADINDGQLENILNQIGRNLKTLKLRFCRNLHNFKAIKNCISLKKLNLAVTKIDDPQLSDILNQIGANLITLNLAGCKKLHNFETIKRNCTHLQRLDLAATNINNNQLVTILIDSKTLIKLNLNSCANLANSQRLIRRRRNCTHLQDLNLSWIKINDKQLAAILNQIGRNLRTLKLAGCKDLHKFEAIRRNCSHLQELYLSWTNINNEQLEDILNHIDGNLRILNLYGCCNLHLKQQQN